MKTLCKYCSRMAIVVLALWSTTGFAGCTVNVQDIRFGTYDPASPVPVNTAAEYTVECREPVVLSIEIGHGLAGSVSGDRRMQHELGRDTLAYNLFLDTTMTQVWGEGSGNGARMGRVEGRTTGFIYGQIRAGQDVTVGQYSDRLRMTILP